jgi:hypothetical protein
MKSDKAKPTMHMSMPAHKTNHPAAEASMGANEHPRKSHEADVALGEGLEYGAVHSAHKKDSVKDAKHVMGLDAASRARQVARENGSADKD